MRTKHETHLSARTPLLLLRSIAMSQGSTFAPLLSGRSLATVQAASGLAFSTFLSLHLTNTAIAALGPASYDAAQAAFRGYYRIPLIEFGVLGGSLVAHVASSAAIFLRKKSAAAERAKQAKKSDDASSSDGDAKTETLGRLLHRITGFILVGLLPGHVLATRFVPAFVYPLVTGSSAADNADFTMVTYSVQETFGRGFMVYYTVLALSGLFHMSYGIFKAVGTLRPAARKSRPFAWIWNGKVLPTALLAITGGAVVVGVASISGFLFPVDIPRRSLFHSVETNLVALVRQAIFGTSA